VPHAHLYFPSPFVVDWGGWKQPVGSYGSIPPPSLIYIYISIPLYSYLCVYSHIYFFYFISFSLTEKNLFMSPTCVWGMYHFPSFPLHISLQYTLSKTLHAQTKTTIPQGWGWTNVGLWLEKTKYSWLFSSSNVVNWNCVNWLTWRSQRQVELWFALAHR